MTMRGASNPYILLSPVELGRTNDGTLACTLAPFPAEKAALLGDAFAAIDPWASYPYPASALARYFADAEPGAPRYLVMVGEDIAGVVGLRLNWLRGPYLQFLGILPPYQGQALGARVLAWLEAAALSATDSNLWVCASDFNRDGIKFYERHGFARIAEIDGLVKDGKTEVLFRKQLAF